MIDRDHGLSLSRQAKALGISRGGVYYLPPPVSGADLKLMRRIDELHLGYRFAGSWMLKGLLNGEGHEVGRCHVATLMKRMGITAIYRRPNTSRPAPCGRISTVTKAGPSPHWPISHGRSDDIRQRRLGPGDEIVFLLVVERFLRANVLAKVGR